MFLKKRGLLAAALCSTLVLQALDVSGKNQEGIYTKLAHSTLPAYAEFTNIYELDDEATDKPNTEHDFTIQKLSDYEKRAIVFGILDGTFGEQTITDQEIFPYKYWADIELFCGPKKKEKLSLFKQINRTKTIFGETALRKMLAEPTTNIDTLQKRQAAIKALIDNPAMFQKLDYCRQAFRSAENNLFLFWKSENPFNQQILDQIYFSTELSGLNKSAVALEAKTMLKNAVLGLNVMSMPFLLSFYLWKTGFDGARNQGQQGWQAAWTGVQLIPTIVSYLWNVFTNLNGQMRAAVGGYVAFLSFMEGVTIYATYKAKKIDIDTKTYLQKKLIAVANAIKAIRAAYGAIKSNSALIGAIPMKHMARLKNGSKKLDKLIKPLLTNTFAGQASAFSWTGRILATYKVMLEMKNDLIGAFLEFGQLDALCSNAELIQKFTQTPARFCFAQYVESDQPYIKADEFWFPSLLNNPNCPVKKVVTNSIQMGTDEEKETSRQILVTGPNKGGKSTILKGIHTNILLAQTIGIVPADSFALTPFSKIQSHINIEDNTSEGISKFQNELRQAAEVLYEIEQLGKNEFSFSIIDEPFTATDPESAIQGSAYVIGTIANNPKTLSIIATHFGILTTLEEKTNGKCTNHRIIDATIHEDGTLTYPYTWEPGISQQHLGMHLVKLEGLEDPYGLEIAEEFAQEIALYGIV